MQTRFSASNHSGRPFTATPLSPRKYTSSHVTRHQTCVIDLSEADETPSTQDYLLSQQNIQPNRENAHEASLAMSQGIKKQKFEGLWVLQGEEVGNSQSRQGKRKYQKKKKETVISQDSSPVVDLDSQFGKEIVKSSCTTNKSNNKAINLLFNQLTTKTSNRQSEHTQDNIFPSNLNYSFNLQGKQPRRRTRNRPRIEGQFYEQPAQIDFYDDEVKTRIKVAKYRYSIQQCSKQIDWLNTRVSPRIHNCQKSAQVSSEPQVPVGCYKHRILLQCLKMQFKKRKFVYLE